jgi:heterotetrameric sarcosine oxidase gamma subunit
MLERTHPLAASAAVSPDCPAAQLASVAPARRFIIRGDAAALASMGLLLPGTCRATTTGNCVLLWLGPDEFLLLGSNDVVQSDACVVDVSHRDTALTVSGPLAVWLINGFCALDLQEAAFPIGMCTRTVFGKAEIVLWRTAAETFRIEVARSFAPYVWACLEEARREFLA